MSGFVGHQEVVRVLEQDLPPVTMLLGPSSVGKWTLCHHLAAHHQAGMADRLIWSDQLTADGARKVLAFAATAPFGAFKLIQLRLDAASSTSLNTLLKTLEEPPPTVRFLLTSSGCTLPTIMSRAQIFRMGLLSCEELRTVLLGQGMSAAAADRAAALGRGQVRTALRVDCSDATRTTVLNIARAVATTDPELFERAFKTWDERCKDLLIAWAVETVTGRWTQFTPDDTFGLHRQTRRALAVLLALNQLPAAQSRLGVRAALEPFLTPR